MKTLYYNGKIYTGETFTDCFAVEDGTFLSVRENEIYDETIDLHGHFVCPGFNDSHLHLLGYGHSLSAARLDKHTDSLSGMLDYLKDYLADHQLSDGEWLIGRGWNQDYFTDTDRMPDRYDLDKVSLDIPIFLTRACGHCCVINSKALQLTGLNNDSIPPEGGSFGKDHGILNGLFYENAVEMIQSFIPLPSKEEIKKKILLAGESLNQFGITSVQSDDYCVFRQIPAETINEAFQELKNEGKLPVRVYEQCNFTDYEQLKSFIEKGNLTGKGDDWFRIGPLKIVADGSLGSRTAHLSVPYQDDPSTCGYSLFGDEQLQQMISYAHDKGMQIAVHAIGDQCLDQVLNAFRKALNASFRQDHRHGIVHCQISRKDQLETMSELHLHIYAQSVFLDYDNHIVEERVGKGLASTSYNWKTLMNKGLIVSNGSDAPVEIPDVMKGIECAVTRTSMDGTGPYLPEQAFTVKEAIDSFTSSSAIASFEEDHKGLIKEGYLADFVILDQNPFVIDKYHLHNIQVLSTFLNGSCVYKKTETLSSDQISA